MVNCRKGYALELWHDTINGAKSNSLNNLNENVENRPSTFNKAKYYNNPVLDF